MFDNRKRLVLFACLINIPLLVGCILNIRQLVEVAGDNRGQLPIRSLRVTIDPSQREELFEQFRKFAEKHGFKIEISDYGTGGENYLIWMLRDNIKIIAGHSRPDPELVSVGFYEQNRATPIPEETIETIDELVVDLMSFINEIQNVTITEE